MKRLGRKLRLPRATWVLFGASVVAALAAAALMFAPAGGNTGPAAAHEEPEGCDATVGAANAQIDAPGTLVPIVEGQVINYRLRVGYPNTNDAELCQAFNVDVWVKLPGESSFQLACTHAVINEGETLQCPSTVPYTAEGSDRTQGVLQAFIFGIGDKHDQPDDCITAPDNPNTGLGPVCFGAQATSNLPMASTPTPTPTVTPTNTPTNTPTTPENTPTNTPERDGTSTPVNPPPQFTPTAPPATPPPPTPINTTLPATVAPQPSSTPIGVTLPPAGSGGGPMGDLTLPVAVLAVLALIFAGSGIIVAKREGL
jgi:hypothetical protein